MSWIEVEGAAYWALYVASFLFVAVWESRRARRRPLWPTGRRWGHHALLLLVSAIALTLVLRSSPVIIAASAARNRYGLLNKPWMPFILQCAVTILVLDLARYVMHRLFHAARFLWRVHEVHHSDPDFDVSTGARFHPLEVVSTQAGYFAVIILL